MYTNYSPWGTKRASGSRYIYIYIYILYTPRVLRELRDEDYINCVIVVASTQSSLLSSVDLLVHGSHF